MRALVAFAIPGVLVAACASRDAAAPREPTAQEWAEARKVLTQLRESARRDPYVARVALSMTEPRSGRTFDGRGAVAVAPGRALRMIIVGPGGGTAMDAWVTPRAWRFAVPALEIVRRGGATNEDAHGLPIGFFRWWFLAPLDGDLLRARWDGDERSFLLRSGEATAKVRHASHGDRLDLDVERRDSGGVEHLVWSCATLEARPGDHGTYAQESTGLRVTIHVEGIAEEPPAPESFVDPDGTGGAR